MAWQPPVREMAPLYAMGQPERRVCIAPRGHQVEAVVFAPTVEDGLLLASRLGAQTGGNNYAHVEGGVLQILAYNCDEQRVRTTNKCYVHPAMAEDPDVVTAVGYALGCREDQTPVTYTDESGYLVYSVWDL